MAEPIALAQIGPLRGKSVVSSDGKTVGKVDAIHYDGLTKEPEWVEVKAGLLSSRLYIVPLEGAIVEHNQLMLPFTRELVIGEPKFESLGGLTSKVEEAMNQHFGTPPIKRHRVMEVLREGDWGIWRDHVAGS